MVKRPYIPETGDIVWISFDEAGGQAAGRRPFLVLSPSQYNGAAGFVLGCPITRKVKGYPFEVPVSGQRIEGVALADQVRSIDWPAREAAFLEQATDAVVEDVKALLATLLQIA